MRQRGIEAVRIEPLAEQLGVTKGSFYWHFADRAALHAALLERWHQDTRELIARLDATDEPPRVKLRRLIAFATRSLAGARTDIAVRAWASHDADAARKVAIVDAARVDYLAGILLAIGLDRRMARVRGRIVYLAIVGNNFTLAYGQALSERELWGELERLMVRRAGRVSS